MEFKNKQILIVGLGISNVAVTKYLADKKIASLTITDLKKEEELRKDVAQIKKVFPAARFVLGEHKIKDFLEVDLVIRNPSVPVESPFIKKAIDAGIPIETDVSLFFQTGDAQLKIQKDRFDLKVKKSKIYL